MTTIEERKTPVQPLPEIARVPHPDDMDLELFIKHFAARHADSLPKDYRLSSANMTPYVEDCWRRFHERLHRLRTGPNGGYEHEHKVPASRSKR